MPPLADKPTPDDLIPSRTLFVRHRDEITEVDRVCPDMWPYTHIAQHRDMAGMSPDDPGPMHLTSIVTGESVEVTGSGIDSDRPMHSPQMEDRPLPRCTCAAALDDGAVGG